MKKGAHELKLRSLKRDCCHTCVGVSALWGDGGKWWLLRLLLQGSGKQQTGFSCCYEKKLPWLGEAVLLGYCTQDPSKLSGRSKSLLPLLALSSPLLVRDQEEASWKKPAEMWFVQFQSQHHKSTYRRVGLELRELREHIHKENLHPSHIING